MSTVKFKILENNTLKPHSFYAVPVATGRLTFDEVCEEASDGKSVTPATMRMCVSEYMKAAQRELIRGFRVPLGEDFLTLYPNIHVAVRDTVDKDGKTIKATADMVHVSQALSRVGCSVSGKFSARFAQNVSWQRVDPVTGSPITDEDVTDQDGTKTEGSGTSSDGTIQGGTTQGGTSSGGTSSGGSGTEKEG